MAIDAYIGESVLANASTSVEHAYMDSIRIEGKSPVPVNLIRVPYYKLLCPSLAANETYFSVLYSIYTIYNYLYYSSIS